MWKAAIGKDLSSDLNSDDWETDPDFVNEINEEEQRYGGTKTVGAIDMKQLREETEKAYEDKKKLQYEENGTGSRGYGGKFGVEKDRMDKSAVGHDYIGKVEKHSSQTDQKQGFGGKFGIEKDRMDKCAVGHDYIGKVEKHSSQTDQKQGFGGKFGVEKDRMDKSALGHDYIAKPEKHSSQIDHSRGFGGKFGVEKDRMDRSAVGHDYKSNIEKHSSQVDHKSGFGGKFGVQKDRMDRSAVGHDYISKPEVHSSQTNYTKHLKEIPAAQTEDFKASNIRAKFENLIKTSEKEPLQKPKLQKHIQTKTPLSVVNVAPELEGFKTEPEIDVLKTQEPCLEPVPELPKVVEEEKSVVIAAEVKTDEINHNPEIELHSNVPLYEQEPEEIVLNPENPGITAIALYDYQAAAEDEISFDPNDIITHVEMIDEGWWRGYCDKTKQYGLFPSNYVQLQE